MDRLRAFRKENLGTEEAWREGEEEEKMNEIDARLYLSCFFFLNFSIVTAMPYRKTDIGLNRCKQQILSTPTHPPTHSTAITLQDCGLTPASISMICRISSSIIPGGAL